MAVSNWVGTANIGREKSPSYRMRAMDRISNVFTQAIWGFQEIDEGDTGDEHAGLRRAFKGYSFAGFGEREPVAVSSTWRVLNTQVLAGHPPIAHISPTRHIIMTRLRHTKTGIEYTHFNSHPVTGAFTTPGQKDEPERRQDWNLWFGRLKDAVAAQLRFGHTVIFTSDTNRPDLPKIHPREERYIQSGLDYVIGVEPAHPHVKIVKTSVRHISIGVDGHRAHAAKVTFSAVD